MIFVDTGFFFALAADDDPDHERVREVFEEFPGSKVLQRASRSHPPGDPEEEKNVFDCLVKHQDKGYSAAECLSVVIMEARGIKEALTLDGDFKHRFTPRPGPRS